MFNLFNVSLSDISRMWDAAYELVGTVLAIEACGRVLHAQNRRNTP